MTDTPHLCPYCTALAPEFTGLFDAEIVSDGTRVPVEFTWVCGLQTDPETGPYHGPLIELRPPDEATGYALLRRLGLNGNA